MLLIKNSSEEHQLTYDICAEQQQTQSIYLFLKYTMEQQKMYLITLKNIVIVIVNLQPR